MVVIGLLILIATAYMSAATEVSKKLIDTLVLCSLGVELIGIIVIVYNTIKSDK